MYLRLIQAIYLPGQEQFIHKAIEIFQAFSQTDPEIRFDYMERSVAYISAVREDLTDQNIVDIVTYEGGSGMETIIERLEKRGITIGEQRGQRREKLAFALKMKQDLFLIEKIMEYTGLSQEEILDL